MSVIVPVRAMHGCLRTRLFALHGRGVFAKRGCTVALRPKIEGLLTRFHILLLAAPGFDRGILKRPPIRETDRPWLQQIEPVNRIQMSRREDVTLPSR